MAISRLEATSFGVQYVQGAQALDVAGLAAADHDLLILEALNLAPGYDVEAGTTDVAALQAGGKQVFLYMTVGESSDIRRYWDDAWTDPANAGPTGAVPAGGGDDVDGRTAQAPSWLSDWISGASGGAARLVQFWDPEWLAILQDEIDFLLGDLGADGLFLDNVASYFEWITFDNSDRAGRPDVRPEDDLDQPATFYAAAMADLVGAVSAYVQTNHPGARIIANGNPFLPFDTGDRAGKGQLFLDSISAMLQEGVYHSGGERYDNAAARNALTTIVAAEGIPILALDYIDPAEPEKIDAFARDAARDGFLPYADELDLALDGLQPALNQPTEGADRLFLPAGGGSVDGLGGDDEIFGGLGAETAVGGTGDDTFFGGGGDDVWRVDADRADAFVSAAQPDAGGPILLTLSGGLGVDELHDVASVAFADQTVALGDLLPAAVDGPDGAPSFVSVERLDAEDRILVTWRVDNPGDEALPAASLAVQMVDAEGSAPLGRSITVSVDALAPGAFDTGTAGFTLPQGLFTPRLRYDPSGSVDEADEANNVVDADPLIVGEVARPDLAVTLVRIDNRQAGPEGLIAVEVEVINLGDAASPPDALRLFLVPSGGGEPIVIFDGSIGALQPLGSAGVVGALPLSTASNLTAGEYVLRATIDPENLRDEADPSNDTRDSDETFTIVTGPPNLAIERLETVDAAVSRADPETTVDFSFDIINDGGADATVTRATVSLVPQGGGAATVIREIDVPPLFSGEVFRVAGGAPIPVDLAAGDYAWRVDLDVDDDMIEADETDNAVVSATTLSVADAPANLVVDLLASDAAAALRTGEAFELTWTVRNAGPVVDGAQIAFFAENAEVGAVELARVDLPALGPGESVSRSTQIAVRSDLRSLTYGLVAVVDPDDALAESDEADNTATAATALDVIAVPDGAARDLSLADATLAQGDDLEFRWTLASQTAGLLPEAGYAVSLIPQFGGAPLEILSRLLPAQTDPDAAAVEVQESLTLAADLAPGDYLLRVVYDPLNAVDETDETNNVVEAAFSVAAVDRFSKSRDVVTLDGPGVARAGGGNDVVRGGGWRDEIYGQNGADTLFGRGELDRLFGGGGPDKLIGGGGPDRLRGGGGPDEIRGGGQADRLWGGPGRDDLFGGPGADRAWGGGGADFLDLGGGRDRGWGGGGADEIEGDGGRDVLRGGNGRDALFGGGGRDRLFGDKGADELHGGRGPDVFVIRRNEGDDVIADFGGRDRVDLRAFDFGGPRQVLRRLERDGADTELNLPGRGEVDFEGIRPGRFDADDFIL